MEENNENIIKVSNEQKVKYAAIKALSVLGKVLHALQSSNMKGTILHNEISDVIKELMNAPLKINFKPIGINEPMKDATKDLLLDIISWEKDLSEYMSLETILKEKYKITKRL